MVRPARGARNQPENEQAAESSESELSQEDDARAAEMAAAAAAAQAQAQQQDPFHQQNNMIMQMGQMLQQMQQQQQQFFQYLQQQNALQQPLPGGNALQPNVGGNPGNLPPPPVGNPLPPHPPPPPAGGVAGPTYSPYGMKLILDGSNRQHFQQFENGCKPFRTLFDGKMENFQLYQANVRQRANKLKCAQIFDVIQAGVVTSVLDKFGEIDIYLCKQAAIPRWANDDWLSQASYIMGQCIIESLTEDFMTQVLRYESEYTMTQQDGSKSPDGAILHHVICNIVSPATFNTAQSIFESLQTLRPSDFDNNIVNFHTAFLNQRNLLLASQGGGNLSSDQNAIHYLLQAYKTVSCFEFRTFIDQLKTMRGTVGNLNQLMRDAEAKYHELVREDLWGKPSPQEVIVALQSKLKKQDENSRKRGKGKVRKKKPGMKKEKRRSLKKIKDDDEEGDNAAWKLKAPKPGKEDEIIQRNGKDWNWCKFHKKYVLSAGRWGSHSSNTCRLNPKN